MGDDGPEYVGEFQTYPCGVEARGTSGRSETRWNGFRRTLVGLKQRGIRLGAGARQRFQTYPCGVEARAYRILRLINSVSDVPLWG